MNYRRAIRYQVSDEFKAECKANVNRYNRLGRIYVIEDNTSITENDNLVSFEVEDDCYVNDKFIGSVVSKKITVNILNPNNAINLENKTIQVNTGIDFNGTQELMPIGRFIVQKPDNKEVKENTTFTGYDEIIKFNKTYKDLDYENLDTQGNPQEMAYPIKVKDFLRKLCLQVGVDYIYESIVNEDYYILGNPFTNGENCRTVLSNIAQLCGGFAKMGRDNRLHIITLISAQNDETIVDEIDGNNYDTTFSKNNIYGEVNSLILRLSQVEGENTVREDATSIAENGLTEITIADNYFLTDNSQRELVIDNIWNALKGLKYLPISTDYYGYPYLDSGDLIKVLDSEDNEFYTYIFNHSFKYDGSYSGKIETVALTKTQTAYKNTQNLKERVKNVEFIVNKIDGKIESVVSKTDPDSLVNQVSRATQDLDGFQKEIGKLDLEGNISTLSTLKETVEGWEQRLDQKGGNNIFYYAKEFWTGETDEDTANLEEVSDTIKQYSVSGMGYLIKQGSSKQKVQVNNGTYTISLLYKKVTELAEGYVLLNGNRYDLTETDWKELVLKVDIDTSTIDFEIYSDTDNAFYIFDLMGNVGIEKEIWTQNPNETRTNTVTIGKGIQVNSSSTNTYTRIDADGNRTFNSATGEVVMEATDKGVKAKQVTTDVASIAGILIQEIDGQIWISSLL